MESDKEGKKRQEEAWLKELWELHGEMVKLDQEISDWKRMRVEKAMRSGELLIEIKNSLKPGKWTPWVEKNLPYSLRTAQRYMKLFVKKGDKNDNLSFLGLSYSSFHR
jgi:hypothetical protein